MTNIRVHPIILVFRGFLYAQTRDRESSIPDQECSNGLSGRVVASTAAKYFKVQQKIIKSKLSSLGGRSGNTDAVSDRAARQSARELVLYLLPKRRAAAKKSDGRKHT